MSSPLPALAGPPVSRRDQQKDQTRFDLSLAAFELAREHGLASVRVPQIAAATGVSPRTFNNYFPSKEAAIVWPTTWRGSRLVAGLDEQDEVDGLPAGWFRDFRALVAREPALHGEYLKATSAVEGALADAIARRIGVDDGQLEPLVLAGVVAGAERAAVLYWARHAQTSPALTEVVRAAVGMALRGMAGG